MAKCLTELPALSGDYCHWQVFRALQHVILVDLLWSQCMAYTALYGCFRVAFCYCILKCLFNISSIFILFLILFLILYLSICPVNRTSRSLCLAVFNLDMKAYAIMRENTPS